MRDMALTSLATLVVILIAAFAWNSFTATPAPVEPALVSASTPAPPVNTTAEPPKSAFQNPVEAPAAPVVPAAPLPALAPEEITSSDLSKEYQLRLMDFDSRLKLTSEQRSSVMAAMYEQMRQGIVPSPLGEDPKKQASLVGQTMEKILTADQKAAYAKWLRDQRE